MKMDTSAWKEFHLYDVFDISMGNKMDRGKMSDGDIAFIGRTANNNGINARVGMVVNHEKYGSVKPYSGNCLTLALGGSIGSCFYQEEPFYTSQNVVVLIPRDKQSKESLIFAATAISYCVNNGKYRAFSEELNKHIKTDFVFNLPATPDGHPDWNYMEQYMHSVMENCEKKYQILVRIFQEKHRVDTTDWGEFRVGDLFDVMTSRSIDKIHLDFDVDAPYDFIGRTSINNGVQGKLGKIEFDPNPRGTFSVTQIGERLCQYRENEWYASQNIFVLLPRVDMIRVAFFMTTILTEMLKRIYGDDAYTSYPTLKSLPNDIIKLPITSSGEPDWDYMEQYMKRIMQRQSVVVEALRKIARTS